MTHTAARAIRADRRHFAAEYIPRRSEEVAQQLVQVKRLSKWPSPPAYLNLKAARGARRRGNEWWRGLNSWFME